MTNKGLWWDALAPQWKKGFNEAVWQRGPVTDTPSDAELEDLFTRKVLRMMGPSGTYPNMTFELTDALPLADLTALELLVLGAHRIRTLKPLAPLVGLRSLFVFYNEIDSLEGIEKMTELKDLYFQENQVTDLVPIKSLLKLETIYACQNALTSLDGITKKHSKRLTSFYCLPNDALPDSEVIRVENKLGIRCLKT